MKDKKMNIIDTAIPDVKLLEPQVFGDARGFFMETFRDEWFKTQVCERTFVQENHSKSGKGVLRGLHYQTENTQGKLVRVVVGEVFDVAVDMREGSPTFGKWAGATLSAKPMPALDTRRLRARVLRFGRRGGSRVQMHRLLQA
ncbi:dTDP-4-dehydrorhamnose 3,5-epimerase (dTDP-4-keto-6-deoxyglucose 3,5-epimerase; dTDP-L-rhamnose synthetase) [Neisseria meningitidis]|nr:dTDP-4-dehydrorhamnose 3,5-epimerase (dTDP-4-keto-6-deoxyglucose 3,5-epimerase; dTDP-L-rhamnose synthetase) [Neisseria meningitidis]